MKGLKVKPLVGVMLTLVLLFGLAGCVGKSADTVNKTATDETAEESKASEDKIVLNVGDFKTFPTTAHTIIAENKGFFEDEFTEDNIEVNIYRFLNGPAVNEAFASGAIDVAPVGDQPMLSGIANTRAGKVIAIGERAYGTMGVFANSGSEFTEITQLKGKKIAIAVGTSSQKIYNQLVAEYGFTEADFELVNIPAPADALNALLSGNVDAIAGSTLNFWKSYSSGEIKAVVTNEKYANYVGYEARTEYLEKHPDIVVRYLKVLNRAYEWEKDNTEEAAQIIAEATGIDPGATKELLPKCDLNPIITQADIEALNVTYEFLKEHDLIGSDFVVKDFIDDTFIQQAVSK